MPAPMKTNSQPSACLDPISSFSDDQVWRVEQFSSPSVWIAITTRADLPSSEADTAAITSDAASISGVLPRGSKSA